MIKDIFNKILSNNSNENNTDITQSVANTNSERVNLDTLEKLESNYKWLDKILYCSLEQEIKLAINKDMFGHGEYTYILKGYKISGVSNRVTLELERKDDPYKISFNDIYDIKSNGQKIWIYQKDSTWRFYHYVDNIKFSSLDENFKSKNLELQEDIQIYMKYKDIDNLLYNVEFFKYQYRNSEIDISQKDMIDKLGNKMILVNVLDNKNSFNNSGTITAFSEYGNEGIFHYKFNEESLYIIDMQPHKISQGIGSNALEFMEYTARRYGITKLEGTLSSIDFDHKERLFHFYEKNGFVIDGHNITKTL